MASHKERELGGGGARRRHLRIAARRGRTWMTEIGAAGRLRSYSSVLKLAVASAKRWLLAGLKHAQHTLERPSMVNTLCS
eukprot:365419-Chlamydomonas_euryale.AAC.8